MSQGLQLLDAVRVAGSRAAVRALTPDMFLEGAERDACSFFLSHYRTHGVMPPPEVMRENGHRYITASQPVAYYLDRLRTRNIGNVWMAEHPNFAQAVFNGDVAGGQAVLERMLRASRQNQNVAASVTLAEAGEMVREDYAEARNRVGLRGITFGWDEIDELTLGQSDGDVTVIAARPGVGKTWTMLFLAMAAWRAGHSVLFVSMEMTVLQTARRLIGMLSNLNPKAIRSGRLSSWAQHLLYDCVNDLATGAPFHFLAGDLERSVQDVDNLVQEFTPDIVFIDAAYLLEDGNRDGKFARYAKHEAMQNVFKGVKQIATNRNLPVTCSVQFNREASRKDGTKGLENLAGSDWIGQLASNVFSLELGEEPHQRTTRRYKIQKARDSEGDFEFETDFLFSPFSMAFRREILPGYVHASSNIAAVVQDML